jgi:Gpi18-like mannosyltransferase
MAIQTSWGKRLHQVQWWGQWVAMWLATLVLLTSIGLVSVRVAERFDELGEGYQPGLGVSPNWVPGIWVRWDAYYYIEIAQKGYAALPEHRGFFPFYPMLMKGLSSLTGMSFALSGMLISQTSYLVAILFLYKLARLIRDDHAYAMRSVLYMVIFPTSLFFFAVYAESLSLAFSIIGIYLVVRHQASYGRAGLALGLASIARPVGWLLNVVLLTEFVKRRKFKISSVLPLMVGLALSISGIVLYVLYLYSFTGTFMAIPESMVGWQRQWQYPWMTIWKGIRIAADLQTISNNWFLYAINWSHLFFVTLALVLTIIAFKWSFQHKFRLSLALSLLPWLAFLLSSQGVEGEPLSGVTRWVAALFPFYLVLGGLGEHKFARWLIPILSSGLLAMFTAWFAAGRWIG